MSDMANGDGRVTCGGGTRSAAPDGGTWYAGSASSGTKRIMWVSSDAAKSGSHSRSEGNTIGVYGRWAEEMYSESTKACCNAA